MKRRLESRRPAPARRLPTYGEGSSEGLPIFSSPGAWWDDDTGEGGSTPPSSNGARWARDGLLEAMESKMVVVAVREKDTFTSGVPWQPLGAGAGEGVDSRSNTSFDQGRVLSITGTRGTPT
jgi:hypothetical protein